MKHLKFHGIGEVYALAVCGQKVLYSELAAMGDYVDCPSCEILFTELSERAQVQPTVPPRVLVLEN